MKKVIIACAAVLTLGLMSCGDTKMCYKLSVIVDGREVTTEYVFGTSNDIDAYAAKLKQAQELIFGEALVSVQRSTFSNLKSEADCHE